MAKPIKPDEVKHEIPDEIIEAVNDLINKNWNGSYATVTQDEILSRVSFARDTVFEKRWLDFEELYEAVGWSVSYERPGRDDDFEAYFSFQRKR